MMFRAIFGNSLLSKFGRRYSDSLRDASAFVDQMSAVKKVVPEWRRRAIDLDKNQIEVILREVNNLRDELRALSTEMAVAEGHMHEAAYTGESLVNRLATGAHLSQNENLALLLEGDVDGLAQYLNGTLSVNFDKVLPKVRMEQRAALLEALLKANGKYGNEETEDV